ncbi:type II secretion system F family protein [Patescibacteria group bacterium]|nr:type II secretion system F family protein [Patescibacteria group bacterium]
MLFKYKAIDASGDKKDGEIDAMNKEVAISSLQRRGLVLSSIESAEEVGLLKMNITFFERVKNKDLVILSRQISTLFESQVSALRIFRLLGEETENPLLKRKMAVITKDLQAGNSIAKALSKHPEIFSPFYVNMVRSGEESGKLDKTFIYLADYLERIYEITSKAKNALVYPAFVVGVFIVVMLLIFVFVIPQISQVFTESGQELPLYTRVVMAISTFIIDYWFILIAAVMTLSFFLWRYSNTKEGEYLFSKLRLNTPFIGKLYQKLYLSRIADSFSTMLGSGIPIVRTIELTAEVVGNKIYENLLTDAWEAVRAGSPVSQALSKTEYIPGIMIQMIKVGEETGELSSILNTLAKFYQREVNNSVDTLVGLIEPIMIVVLGLSVGLLLASVLVPIYDLASAI